MQMEELLKKLGSIQKTLQDQRQREYVSETYVRTQIMMPILQLLGWDTSDPQMVRAEYPLKEGKRVDIGLCIETSTKYDLRGIIELKGLGKNISAEDQLFGYAFNAGAPVALLSDGQLFEFYCPLLVGAYNERLVRQLDLLHTDNLETIAKVFERYLSFDNIRSNDAYASMQEDLKKKANQTDAKNKIPQAWKNLVGRKDEILSDILAKETASISNYAPSVKDVTDFLQSLVRKEKAAPEQSQSLQPGRVSEISSGSYSMNFFCLLGEEYTKHTAKEAYTFIFDRLVNEYGTSYLEKLETQLAGRAGNHLSKEISGLPKTARADHNSRHELPEGWWLNCNLSDAQKRKHLRIACNVFNIPFGNRSGLIFSDHKLGQ